MSTHIIGDSSVRKLNWADIDPEDNNNNSNNNNNNNNNDNNNNRDPFAAPLVQPDVPVPIPIPLDPNRRATRSTMALPGRSKDYLYRKNTYS
jgi:hypothetical protein